MLRDMGYALHGTLGTANFLKDNGIPCDIRFWPTDDRKPNALDYIRQKKVDLVINIPKNIEREELDNDYIIRRAAVDHDVPLITNLQVARRFVEAVSRIGIKDLKAKSLDEYV